MEAVNLLRSKDVFPHGHCPFFKKSSRAGTLRESLSLGAYNGISADICFLTISRH